MIYVLFGDHDGVDFREPVYMTSEQKYKFIEFLKSIFEESVINDETINPDKFRTKRLGEVMTMRTWEDEEEKFVLLNNELDSDEIAEKIGRTGMSVYVKRGLLQFDFRQWLNKKKINVYEGDREKFIEDFLQDREKQKKKEREKKQNLKNKLKKYKKELRRLEKIDKSTQRKTYLKIHPEEKEKARKEEEKRITRIKELKKLISELDE